MGVPRFSRWILTGLLPFVALQLVFNVGVTGHLLETPYRYYSDRDQPGTSLGFHRFDPQARAASPLLQKREGYEHFKPLLAEHQLDHLPAIVRERLAATLWNSVPQPLVMLWAPLSALAFCRRRGVMWAALPLFIGLYVLYPYFPAFYSVVALPAGILMTVMGAHALQSAWPGLRRGVGALSTLLLISLAFSVLPETDRRIYDDMGGRPDLLERVDATLQTVSRPAIVLFTYPEAEPRPPVEQEPVYNADVAWPDEASIVRAHDLGTQNARLFAYYAAVQPWRNVYRYDEADGALEYLGTARELARPGFVAPERKGSGKTQAP